jgi:RNA polymerase sigma factor (sigma-70 family)
MGVATMADEDLVALAVGGERGGFDELHRRYRGLVVGVVRSELRDGSDAEDIAQEAFTRAWMKLASLRDASLFRPWLLQITRRAIVDHRRQRGRRPTLTNDDDLTLELVADDEASPSDLAELRSLAREVEGGMAGLSRRDATALSLAVHFGFGTSEIGEALGITPNNAKVVLHRARKRLRESLGSLEPEELSR